MEYQTTAKNYKICNYCIMDTSDRNIRFDENGYCNHCRNYIKIMNNFKQDCELNGGTEKIIKDLINKIKKKKKHPKYDCVLGISGGLDSSYLAYYLKSNGLNPLAVHLDNGWNSELSVDNITHLLKKLAIDLFTLVLDWQSFKDLQLSFLYASTPDAEIPTDHVIFGTLFKVARRFKIKYIITGENMATEGILPRSWTYGIHDWRYINDVHTKFGKTKLINYPHYSIFQQYFWTKILKINIIRPLNYLNYNKLEIENFLTTNYGWRNYKIKHFESIYTRFFQGYILPKKFNIDKRRAHLSALICSNQISRAEALKQLQINNYPPELQQEDKEYVLKKLELTETEFQKIMDLPIKSFNDYNTYYPLIQKTKKYLKMLGFKIIDFDR